MFILSPAQHIIFIICRRNCACFTQFVLRDNRDNAAHRSLPCLLSIPLTARVDSHHSLRHFLNMASTRGKSKGQNNLPNLVSAEAAKKWIVKINKMALHKSVSSVFLIISDKMTSLVQSSTDQSGVFL